MGMFAGRIDEIKLLEQGLHQTKNSQSCNFLVTGERGIGKSSLMMILKGFSSSASASLEHGSFDFITINGVISDRMNLMTLIKLIDRNLKRELGKVESVRKFMDSTWDFVQRIRVMDSGIDKKSTPEEADLIINDFSYSLAETCKRIVNP